VPVSLTQINYFVAVAEEQHVGRAARKLHVSQPPLSRQIRNLEDELGAPLFQRTPRGVTLLPAGARFLAHARAILAEVDAARRAVRFAPRPSGSELAPRPSGSDDPQHGPGDRSMHSSPGASPTGPAAAGP
jgi:DNA-binding transcriptional LysR family regulator